MRRVSLAVFALALGAVAAPACSQTPVVVPLRSMERPKDVDVICLRQLASGAWEGASLEKCAVDRAGAANPENAAYRLHAVVTQLSRGELAVVDLGRQPSDSASLVKVDPRLPGYTFIPVGAAPSDVVADPLGQAVYVASGRDPRIDIIPASILRGPLDTQAAADEDLPWPHLDFNREVDGTPGALTIHQEGCTTTKDPVTQDDVTTCAIRRLYVTLPDAKPQPRIAVYDLVASPLLPPEIGRIELTVAAVPPSPWQTPECIPWTVAGASIGPGNTAPWWAKYESECAAGTATTPVGATTVDVPAASMHFAGVTVAGGKLFVADDRAPFVHVFDVQGGQGREITRIALGAPTSQLAVSPVVPDEVELDNATAVEICEINGWLGDGLDHSADSPVVAQQLGGRCRAHRYVYAVDLVEDPTTSGSIAVVDVPVVTTGGVETLDLPGLQLAQPLACASPTFPARRIPLGPFGVGAANAVPARGVTFLRTNPQVLAGDTLLDPQGGVIPVRCHPWEKDKPPLGLPALATSAGVDAAKARSYEDIATNETLQNGVNPQRLRGTFAYVALMNGAVVAVDVDDYDSLCRGPETDGARGSFFLYPGEKGVGLGVGATNEYYPRVVQRHHPRSLRFLDTNIEPTPSAIVLSQFGSVLSNDVTTDAGKKLPQFALLQDEGQTEPTRLLTSPDNPYTLNSETWIATYEGLLPGFTGAFGAIVDEGAGPVLRDPNVGFCRKGVDTQGPVEAHDAVQLLDDVCVAPGSCPTQADRDACANQFGDANAQPLSIGRSLVVGQAFQDRLTIAKHWAFVPGADGRGTFELRDGAPADLKRCFGNGLVGYGVRSRGSWVVVGSMTGYLHRFIADEATGACVLDPTKPHIQQGRAGELPPLAAGETFETAVVKELCRRFVNPSWQFAIRRGTEPTEQDMRFTFSVRWAWQPLTVTAGVLPTAIEPIARSWDGRERLGWNMIAVVDAVDRGLFVFPGGAPYSSQKLVQ